MLLFSGCTEETATSEEGALVTQGQAETELASFAPTFDDRPIDVSIAFASASYNDAADAVMSKLNFSVNSHRGESPLGSASIEMSEPKIDSTVIEMDSFSLEMRPVLTAEVGGGDSFGIYGGYDLNLISAEGDKLGAFRMAEDGLAPRDMGSCAYQTKLIRNEGNGERMSYHIYPANPTAEEKFRPVLEVEYNANGPAGQTVETPDGTSYMYAFPEGQLTLKPSEQIQLGRDKMAADRTTDSGGGGEMSGSSCSTASGGGGG